MKIVKKNTTYFINLKNDQEKTIIDKYLFSEIDLKEITNEALCLIKEEIKPVVNKNPQQKTTTETKTKIIDLLNDKTLEFKNKLEGNFEKLLNKKDLDVFKEMLNNKEVILHKLSEKYKKSFYKPNVKTYTDVSYIKNENNTKDNIKDIDKFKQNEYVIFKNDFLAQRFSQTFSEQLRKGEIRGTKSFDGQYYVIFTSVFEKISKKILINFKEDFTVLEVAEQLKQPDDLIRCVLEVLKEDCVVIEKKKGIYYQV